MSYTKAILANSYKTGSYVHGALPTGVFSTSFGVDKGGPNTSLKDTLSYGQGEYLTPGTSYVLTTSGTSANTALTDGINGITIIARNNDAYIKVGNGSQTASATSMYLGVGDRVQIDLGQYADPNIAIINGPTAAVSILHITELN